MISIICVYNDDQIFNRYLQSGLKRQTADYELIALDNSRNQFTSAAQALNAGAAQTTSNSKYLMFVHQDIDLRDYEWLAKAEKALDAVPDLGIAGVAGTPKQKGVLLTNITHGQQKTAPGKYTLQTPMPVHTLDECLIIIPRSVFEKTQFDEQLCDGWHAYAVDYCLEMHQLAQGVLVLPLSLHHGSQGSQNRAYFLALKKVLLKHRNANTIIYTTCGHWNTHIPLTLQRLWFFLHSQIAILLKKLISSGLAPEWLLRIQRNRQHRRMLSVQHMTGNATMSTEPRVAIIVLNWNGFNDTVECLNSLKKVSYYNFKTVLVDNGSDNNEGRRLKEIFP
jgi:GT2 family glycosyltransferase